MEEINIMDLDLENLSKKQYEYLVNHTIKILDGIKEDLQKGRLQNVLDKMRYSPGGDDMGLDNYFINFAYKEDDIMDLSDILAKLARLSNYDLKY